MVNADVQRAERLQEREEFFLFYFHWKIWTIYRLHKMSINLEFTDLLLLPAKNKISVNSFHIHFI